MSSVSESRSISLGDPGGLVVLVVRDVADDLAGRRRRRTTGSSACGWRCGRSPRWPRTGSSGWSGSSAPAGSWSRPGSPARTRGCCGCSRRGTRRSTGRRRRRRQLGRRRARAAGARPTELADQHVLRVVGVLVLVDQHVPEPPPVVLGDVRERLQQVHRRHDQVVEVQRVGLRAAGSGSAVYASASTFSIPVCRPWRPTPRGRPARSSGC